MPDSKSRDQGRNRDFEIIIGYVDWIITDVWGRNEIWALVGLILAAE